MENLVIVGNGGFAKEVEWFIERINSIKPTWNFLGFIDKEKSTEKVIGDDEFLCDYNERINVVIAIANPIVRRKLVDKYKNNNQVIFPNIIDPDVIISNKVTIGEGNIICPGTIITVGIEIGDYNIITANCTVGHDAKICDYVTLFTNVSIAGNTVIGNNAYIGTGAQVLQGIKIGDDCVISAGTVVRKSLRDKSLTFTKRAKVVQIPEDDTGILF